MYWAVLLAAMSASPGDAVVARVESEPITVGEVASRAQAAGISPLEALEGVIQEALLARAARAEGFAARPEVKAQLDAERRRLALQRLVEKEILPHIKVSEE